MEGVCLEALLSGIMEGGDKFLLLNETSIVSRNDKTIIVSDKYNIVNCNNVKKFNRSDVNAFDIVSVVSSN